MKTFQINVEDAVDRLTYWIKNEADCDEVARICEEVFGGRVTATEIETLVVKATKTYNGGLSDLTKAIFI